MNIYESHAIYYSVALKTKNRISDQHSQLPHSDAKIERVSPVHSTLKPNLLGLLTDNKLESNFGTNATPHHILEFNLTNSH